MKQFALEINKVCLHSSMFIMWHKIYVFQESRPNDGDGSEELASCADWSDSDSDMDGKEESHNNNVSEASPVLSPVRYF